jgi:hypothetical protein
LGRPALPVLARGASSEWVKPQPGTHRESTSTSSTPRKPTTPQTTESASARPPEKEPLLGLYLPLSGAFAEIGRDFLSGIEFARNQKRPAAGPAWQWQIIDSNITPPAAAVKEFHRTGVWVILGPVSSSRARETATASRERQLPLILWAPRPELCLLGRNIFQHFLNPAGQAQALAGRLHRTSSGKTAMLLPDNHFGRNFAAAFRNATNDTAASAGAAPTIVASIFYDPSATDFGPAILALQEKPAANGEKQGEESDTSTDSGPPIYPFSNLILADFYPRLRLLLPQLTFHGLIQAPICGPRQLHDSRLTRESSTALEGAICCELACEMPEPKPRVTAWKERYQATVGRPSSLYAIYAADTLTLLDRAWANFTSNTAADLTQALLDLPPQPLLSGPTRVDKRGVFKKEFRFLNCKEGTWQPAPPPTSAGKRH